MATNTILFVVASEGYQSVEYSVPKKLLEQAGFVVLTASDAPGTAVAKDDASTTEVNLLVSDAIIENYDGVFFIGGSGALDHLDNENSYRLINDTLEAKKALGAICLSTRILANAGALENKRATGWNGDNLLGSIYKEHNVQYVPQEVVVDGNLITATGPSAAREFGERIITLLQG